MKKLIAVVVPLFLIVGIIVFVINGRSNRMAQMARPNISAGATAVVACPVTGEKVDPATAKLKTVYKGKIYYFCCPGCPEEFAKNPEKYIKSK